MGIKSLYVIRFEDDTDPQMAYRGDGKNTPGVNINKRKNVPDTNRKQVSIGVQYGRMYGSGPFEGLPEYNPDCAACHMHCEYILNGFNFFGMSAEQAKAITNPMQITVGEKTIYK